MDPKKAQIFFVIANILAFPVVGYAFYDFYVVKTALANGELQIPFDSGIYYLLLGSVFWVLLVIQTIGRKNPNSKLLKYASPILVIWFISILVLANVLSAYLVGEFESAGYVKCDDPAEVSRVSRGESSIYVKGSCPEA